MSGRVRAALAPPAFPYVPGMDVCGEVVALGAGVAGLATGDCVVATNADRNVVGGLAEYIEVQARDAVRKPPEVDPLTAAAAVTSSATALHAVRVSARVRPGDRVLVLGGSGGVGSMAVQLAKVDGAALVVATSTQGELVRALGADRVIDYRECDWSADPAYQAERFDVVIDCVGGGRHYTLARRVLKSRWRGGRFVAVAGDNPKPVATTVCQLLGMVLGMLRRPVVTFFCPWLPRYTMPVTTASARAMQTILDLLVAGRVRVPLEPAGPFDFTRAGVVDALQRLGSGHAHGKIVVRIAEQ